MEFSYILFKKLFLYIPFAPYTALQVAMRLSTCMPGLREGEVAEMYAQMVNRLMLEESMD